MNDRSVIHRNGGLPPEGQGGALIVPIDMVDILGAAMREDHGAVALKLQAASGDRVLLGMTPGGVDAMIDTLIKVREQLNAAGVEPTIPFCPVNTAQIGAHKVDDVLFVSMIIDRSLPSAKAFLMPPSSAKAIAQQLRESASKVALARGEIAKPASNAR